MSIDRADGCGGRGLLVVSGAGASGFGISAGFFVLMTLPGRESIVLLRDDIGEAGPEGSAGGDVGLMDSNTAHPSSAF